MDVGGRIFGHNAPVIASGELTMSQTLSGILKNEILRLSKKTAKSYFGPLQAAAAAQRRQIAALRREVAALQRQVKSLHKATGGKTRASTEQDDAEGAPQLRFQVRGLKTLRARLDLSAGDFGRLVGVSGQTVYLWESGKTKPRRSQLLALAEVRKLGKRQVKAKLAEAESAG